MRRRPWLGALAALPLLVLAGVAVAQYWPHDPPPPLPPPRQPVLPDLTMPRLVDVLAAGIEDTDDQQLFFSASIANLGPGPFVVNAVRGDQRGGWRVSQRFHERNGPTTEVATRADMVWGGHGHDHWHVQIGATYRLLSLPDLKVVRVLEKVGYCFFDQTRFDLDIPSAPAAGVFPKNGCNGKSTLALDMGLSPGWQDPYTWVLPDQRLDITGLSDGRYRLVATADPNNWFREADERNNSTWIEIELRTSVSPPRVKVARVGPHATAGRT